FNGEIFNYIEIRDELKLAGVRFKTETDTEVLLHAYILWGKSCLHRFNGMWSFCIYDTQEKTAFVARDRFGVKPFYYLKRSDAMYWCSEIPPLLPHVEGGVKANEQAIFDFLVFNRTDLDETTFFKDIVRLDHGHCMTISPEGIEVEKWYSLQDAVAKAKSFESEQELLEMFESSLRLRLRSDVPVGVCLSGGIDSSSIAATLIQRLGFHELNTFSAVYQPGDHGDETPFIREMEPLVKSMHYIQPDGASLHQDLHRFVEAHAEPIPSTSPYAQFKVMELAAKHVVVTLDGQGADEELAGYHYFFGFYFKELLRKGRLGKLIKEIVANAYKHKTSMAIKSFAYFLLPEKWRTKARVDSWNYLNKAFTAQYTASNKVAGSIHGSANLNASLMDHFEYKLEHLLKWEDRNSMYFSIEARVPFLDYRLVERIMATPSHWKIRNGMTKHILREAMKGILPEKIRMRRDKMGFDTPQDEWFRSNQWQAEVMNILSSESFRNRGILDADQAVEIYKRHLRREIQASKEIWKMIHLELWFRKFIDGKS
ncbi:MAG: asparagine synthase (glutamine-hydrolyzing), partial [Flavobacteriales bacterium]